MTRFSLAGPLLAAAVAATILLASETAGSHPVPPLLLLLAVTAAWGFGRLSAIDPLLRVLVPAAVAVGAVVAVLLAADGTSGKPLAGPLGYGNANGALCLLGVAATVLAAAALSRRWLPLALLALVPLLLAVLTGSRAAAALAVLVLLGATLLLRERSSRPVLLLALALPLAGLLVTALLARSHSEVSGGLSQRRVTLWSESLDLANAHPLTGVGPGRFSVTAPTAVRDPDARWSHSLVLQQAAETGWLGAAALLGLLAWASAALYRARSRDRRQLIGALALGCVLLQADIDYIGHFAAVGILLALLVGSASAPSRASAG